MSKFIRDHIDFACFYFGSSLLITIFYRILTHSKIEIIYPMLISFFLFCIFVLIRFYKYYSFNKNLSKCLHDPYYKLDTKTIEQKEISDLIEGIHEMYLNRIHKMQEDEEYNKRFISQWIHNMKTPISVISLIIEQVNKSENTYKIATAFKDIKVENERLYNNLEQVLSLLRIDEFSKDFSPKAMDLVASLKKIINSKKSLFIYNRVYPKIEYEKESINVLSDEKWNEVMLDQIITNAVKYSAFKNTSKYIFLKVLEVDNKVILSIRDEGVGIPQYDIKRIFEPFFTGENGRLYKNSSGIGLYLCSLIANKLNHKIDIKSKQGEGCEVTITYLSKL